jgi:outer membrane protein TolC
LLAEHLRISPTVTLFAPEPRIEPLGLFDGELDLDALLEEAVTTRPEVAEALLRVEAAANELTGARLGPWVPSLFAYYEGSGFGENFGNLKDREELAVGLQWDLSPARFARSQLARLELQDEKLALAHTRESIRAAATRYFEWVRIAAPLIEQAGRRVEASEEALSVVQERYEAGSALILEVIEVQRELALARRQWVRVTLDNNRSERRLAFAVGR